MKRFRSAFAGLLALLLVFSGLPVYGAAAASGDGGGTGANLVPTGTVLIQNKWQSNYLYEASDGTVRYGMINPGDTSGHWKVTTTGGVSLIRNVKTNHYITVQGNSGKSDSLKAKEITSETSVNEKWLIDTSSRAGYMVIRSATQPAGQLTIHEQDQLGYAQVSSDINITFESPQWAFLDLSLTPVRLESRSNPGSVIYEDTGYVQEEGNAHGNLMHGKRPLGDTSAQWYIEPGSAEGTFKFRNQATGHYITQNTITWAGIYSKAVDPAAPALSEWIQAEANDNNPATVDTGYYSFANAALKAGSPPADAWLTPQEPSDNHVRANSWPGWAGNFTAQWKIVTVSKLKPVRIAVYTFEQSVSDYLYETADGQLKYGALSTDGAEADKYLWYVEDYDGHKRIRNTASDHYLKYDGGSISAQNVSASSSSDQWIFNESYDFDDSWTFESLGGDNVYLTSLAEGEADAGADGTAFEAQWQLVDPNLPAGGSGNYYRIQSGWQSFYWYETDEGILKYGNMRGDGSDQWTVQKYEGRKLFKNRKTGHYLNMDNMTDGHLRVSPLADPDAPAAAFLWSAKNTGDSVYLISSVLDYVPGQKPVKYISLQNLTKYPEYGVINPTWGSPKWRLVQVPEAKHDLFRFKIGGTGDEALYLKDGPVPEQKTLSASRQSVSDSVYNADSGTGQDGQEMQSATAAGEEQNPQQEAAGAKRLTALDAPVTVGQATYGELDPDDESFVWQLQPINNANGAVKLKNRGTGRYLSLQSFGDDNISLESPTIPVETLTTVYDSWGSIKWTVDMDESGNTTFKSGWAGHYLYAARDENDQPVLRVSRAEGIEASDSARFIAEEVPYPTLPVPEVPVRLKNEASGEYLYENEHGVVLYGQVAADNGYSHWMISTEDGKQYIVNRGSGHYLTLNSNYPYLDSVSSEPAGDGSSEWSFSQGSDGVNYTIRSLLGMYDDEYVNISNKNGYAGHGLLLETSKEVRWITETAPADFVLPPGEPVNSDTGTPVQDDSNIIRIETRDGEVLAEQNGAAVLLSDPESAAHVQWLWRDFNGRKLLMNVETKHYLTITENGEAAVLPFDGSEAGQWIVEDRLGYKVIVNAADGETLDYDVTLVEVSDQQAGAASLWSFTPIASDVVYPGVEAFQGDDVLRFTVNTEQAGEHMVTLRYKNSGNSAVSASVLVNGLNAKNITLNPSGAWQQIELKLALRAGINTIALSSGPSGSDSVAVDSLTLKNSVNKDYRGATLPYITYEAEDAATNGTVISPSRKYRTIASESSGRQAVSLNQEGDYVQFTLAEAANSLVLRYSIPDSPDGAGANDTLTLYVDGVKSKLHLTSKYAWEYGSYPWSNDPKQGSAHRFYDEIHELIGSAPAGAEIKLVKEADDEASTYVIDLVDMEQIAPAIDMPAGFLSVTDFGAVSGDDEDDTAAFKAALVQATAEGKGVWFPEGSFDVGDGLLDLQSAEIRGAGMWYTTLKGAKFFGHGGKVGVYDLMIDGGINIREDEAYTNAFHGAFGQGSLIQNVWIEHTKAGLWLTQPVHETARTNGLHLVGLRIRNLMADGINFAVGTSGSMIEQSDIRYPGDDGIAMWSFTDDKLKDVNGSERTPSVNNTARFNTVSLPWLADNIVVFGGKDNKIQDNIAKDTITNGAGIAVSTRFTAEPFDGITVVERNTLIRTGSYDSGYDINLGAIWLYAGEGNMDSTIIVSDNTVLDSTYSGLIAHGEKTMNSVMLDNNVFDELGTNGIEITSKLQGDLLVRNAVIRGSRMAQAVNPSPDFTITELDEGIATAVKPFSIELEDGQTEAFIMKKGDSSAIRLLDKDGQEITDGITVTFTANNGIAAYQNGRLKAVGEGQATFFVHMGNKERYYSIVVLPNGVAPEGPGGGTPSAPQTSPAPGIDTSVFDALLKVPLTSGNAAIEVTADKDGSVRFGAAALHSAVAANSKGTVEINSGGTLYRLPLPLAEQALKNTGLTGGILEVKVTKQTGSQVADLTGKAKEQGLQLAGPPVSFELNVTDGRTSVPVGRLGAVHVERVFTLEGAMNPATSVAMVFDAPSGTFRYVPALFETVNGSTRVTVKSSLGSAVIAVADHSATFDDVTGHWAQEDIDLLASKLILNGKTEGCFAPGASVNRAEFAAMLVRSLGLQPTASVSTTKVDFTDVKDTSWFAADARSAALLGLVQGYADGSFRPDAPITREQMAVMASRALELLHDQATEKDNSGPLVSFKDASGISSWAKDAVELLTASGIMNGQPSGSFAPTSNTSRAEAAVILRRLLTEMKLLNP
ncbi:S-layer homology domain-containing protein [Paenibacillus sp. sgz500958]|uniref:S-layer homology domain-containing protein n=1 Tax=Paenibacillus sp. sgz500958 TaxID=3242475 RepID=UPI0036D3D126